MVVKINDYRPIDAYSIQPFHVCCGGFTALNIIGQLDIVAGISRRVSQKDIKSLVRADEIRIRRRIRTRDRNICGAGTDNTKNTK